MIVITSPTAIPNEIDLIHALLDLGLERLHIRKPGFSETEMCVYLTAIGNAFKSQLVLHQQHHLAHCFGITRIHNPKTASKKEGVVFSASTHSMTEFNALESHYAYAFLSPIYPSISKPGYTAPTPLLETVTQRTNFQTKLVALGGITPDNILQIKQKGFDEVALLGALWNHNNPIQLFKTCQQLVLSF